MSELPVAPALNDPAPQEQWQRLDRRTIWVAPLRPLLNVLFVGVLVVTVRGWQTLGSWEPAVGGGIAVALFVGYAAHWATTRYRITDTHVELRGGVLVRKHRSVARDRLRTVDVTAEVFHRIFGVAVVKIGTGRHGGSAEDELKLEAVSAADAERLRTVLLRRASVATRAPEVPAETPVGKSTVEEPAADGTAVSTFDPRWVRYAPLTLMGLVAAGLLVGGVLQLARTLNIEVFSSGPVRELFDWFTRTPLVVSIAVSLGVVLVVSTVLSVVLYLVLYWDYRLTRDSDGTLRVGYGLLTRRSVSIEGRRVRGVKVEEPMLLRLGRGARCKAVATGLGVQSQRGDKLTMDADLLLPQAPSAEAHRVAAEVLRVDASPTAVALRRHPVAAARRLVVWSALAAAVPAAVLGVLAELGVVPPWIWQVLLVLVPVGALYGLSEYRNLGHALTGEHLVTRRGSSRRDTVALGRGGIIGWRVRQSAFQRRSRLVTVGALTAAGGGEYAVSLVDQDEGMALAEAAVPGLLTPFLEREETPYVP